MILMIQKGIREGMCKPTHRYAKANNKCMKDYDKKIESSYLTYLDANNLYGWAMSQWEDDLSRFNEDFMKSQNENSAEGIFFNQILSTYKHYEDLIKTYHFRLKEENQKKYKNLFVVQKTKKNMPFT